MSDPLRPTVIDHFSRALGMFSDAVEACPDDEWRRGAPDYVRPAGLAVHVVETLDFYTSDMPGDEFPWGKRLGVDWEETDGDRLPAKDGVTDYLDDAENQLRDWIASADLKAPEDVYPWTGSTKLARLLYVLRHTQHHTAEMRVELMRRGHDIDPGWR